MALPASDNFNRSPGDVGANWTDVIGGWDVGASNNATPSIFGYNSSYWSADAFAADHYAQALIVQLSDGGPSCRVLSGPARSYHFDAKAGAGNSKLQKDVNGSFTDLLTGLTAVNGDVLYIEAVGTTIKVKVNGVQVGTDATDSAIATGACGMWSWDTGTNMDDFLADNIGGGAAPTVNKPGRVELERPFNMVRGRR